MGYALANGRKECPKCGRKGLGFAGHPHAFGWKDYTRARCRYCGALFKVKDPMNEVLEIGRSVDGGETEGHTRRTE